MRLRALIIMVLPLLVAACASPGPDTALRIEGISFQNTTTDTLSDVRLSVQKISGIVSCGPILAGNVCSTTFPLREYQRNPITLSWTQDGRHWSNGPFVIELPEVVMQGKPAMVIIRIGEQGAVSTKMLQ